MSTLLRLWLAWLATLLGYQALVSVRFEPKRPDTVLPWTVFCPTASGRSAACC